MSSTSRPNSEDSLTDSPVESTPLDLAPLAVPETFRLSSNRDAQQTTASQPAANKLAESPLAERLLDATTSSQNQASSTQTMAPPSAADLVIAICPPSFRAALQPWIDRRQREGLQVTVLPSQATPQALKQALLESDHNRCKYLLLVGDCPATPNGEPVDPTQFIPTIYRDADVTAPYQQSPRLPGDYAYGDFDDDGQVQAAVGRLPVKNAEQLSSFITRLIAYEDNSDLGQWRSRVDLVAGVGGFGKMIDGAIEMVASSIITGGLPGNVRTRITHASPTSDFHPGYDQFTATVLNNYRDGARFWVYAGHGWINELDRVPGGPFGRPVLAADDIPALQCPPTHSPIALLLACYTGAMDVNEDCLAERMLLADQGPIAVLAGSRVTMPYGNATAALGLIQAVYHHRVPRLGDAWRMALQEMATPTQQDPQLTARRAMVDGIASLLGGGGRIDDERREHMQLYNWLGDPTLRLGADASLDVKAVGDATIGTTLAIEGTSPVAGQMTLEIHRKLGTPTAKSDTRNRYIKANDTLIVSHQLHVDAGPWKAEVQIPPLEIDVPLLPITISASISDSRTVAAGSQQSWLRKPAATKIISSAATQPTAVN